MKHGAGSSRLHVERDGLDAVISQPAQNWPQVIFAACTTGLCVHEVEHPRHDFLIAERNNEAVTDDTVVE